jgi:hypothetical protein
MLQKKLRREEILISSRLRVQDAVAGFSLSMWRRCSSG